MNYNLANNTFGDEETQAILEVIKSGQLTMGEKVKEFERAFAKRFDSPFAVMVNSGSSANLLGLASLFYKKEHPLKEGDEIIVPAVSWATTYSPLQQYGLHLKFVDIDRSTLNIDTNLLERALTKKTRAVMAVNIMGNPCNFDELKRFCQSHHLYLIEDNCEGMGAKFQDQYCGSFGDIASFSLYFSHHMSTIEGGMILTSHKELDEIIRSLRAHGWSRELDDNSELNPFSQTLSKEIYQFILPGYNLRPTEIQAAIGLVQIQRFNSFINQRLKNAQTFQSLFKDSERYFIQSENGQSSWYGFTLILKPDFRQKRQIIFSKLAQNGIEYRTIVGGNFTRHEVIKYFNYDCLEPLTNADLVHEHGFFIGNDDRDLGKELEHIYHILHA